MLFLNHHFSIVFLGYTRQLREITNKFKKKKNQKHFFLKKKNKKNKHLTSEKQTTPLYLSKFNCPNTVKNESY